eukprot:456721_1
MINTDNASNQYGLSRLTEDQFHASRHLLIMGFGSNISLDAVKRYGTNIQACINYMKDEQEHAEEQEEEEKSTTSKESKEDDAQTYKERIDALLEEQKSKHQQDVWSKESIYELVDRQYANNNGIDGFIEDCGEYSVNIDGVYAKEMGKCDMDTCPYIKREYRNRSIYDTNGKKRLRLYSHCESERSVVIQQFVDQMHINKYHLTDVGLRHIKNDENDRAVVTETDIAKPDWAPVYLDVIAQRKRFDKMMKNDRTKSNKFVTKVLEHDGNDSYSKDSNYTPYSFGIRFYYHKYYQNNSTKCEVLPETKPAVFEFGNAHINSKYSYSSWFVSPKHKSMKDEVLNATNHSLTIIQYENTVMKAIMKHKAIRGTIKGAGSLWKVVYEIPKGSRISEQHILAVLLYTNHIDLSASFSRSFHKLKGTERDDEIKERHSHYANWARILRETVECWGYSLWETAKTRSTFHHGISKQMTFDGFSHRFCGPTSTTLQYETAMISLFANQHEGEEEGVLISFKNNKKAASFFDCIRWSDCSGESEMLFLGGFDPLDVCGLTVLDNRLNMRYFNWITAMKVFRTGLTDGDVTTDKVRAVTVKHIDLLVDNLLNKRKANDIPAYIQTLFEEILSKIPRIIIDIGRMNEVICYTKGDGTVCYGYKRLKHLYFDDKNEIKWNVWRQLYPGLERIDIHSVVKIPSEENGVQFEYRESIFVDDVLMLGILSFLKQTKIKKIEIFYTKNSKD